MAREDVVQAALLAIQDGQKQVLVDQLSSVFDQGEAVGTGPGFTQADIDAAVLAAVEPLNGQIAALTAKDEADILAGQQALADAQAQSAQVLASLQAQYDALSVKEGQEASVIAGLQGSLSQLQQVVSILQGLGVSVVVQP